MALESSAQPERILDIVLATQRLRDLLPPELRNEATSASLLGKLEAADEASDLSVRLSDALFQIAEVMEHAPVEILPVLRWRTIPDAWEKFHEDLIVSLRQRNYPAFDFDLADELPPGCTFTRIIWFIPDWSALVGDSTGSVATHLARWSDLASGALSLWSTTADTAAALPPQLQKWRLPRHTRIVAPAAATPAGVDLILSELERRLDRHRDGAIPANDAPEKWKDRLGITPDADAFARIIADATLVPPLAVAIFGPWGSGKSSFMREIDERIPKPALSAKRDATSPLITRTIWFNAWHYVESDLWASLAARIFDCLNDPSLASPTASDAATASKAAAQRQELVGKMQITQLAITALEQNSRERVARLEIEQQKLSVATTASQSELVKLRAGVGAVFKALGPNLEASLDPAQKNALARAKEPVKSLIAGADSIEEEWKQLQTSTLLPHSWRELRTRPWVWAISIGLILALATIDRWAPSLRGLYANVWGIAGRIALSLSPVTVVIGQVLRRLNTARQQYAAVLKDEQAKLVAAQTSAVAAQQQDLAQTQQAIAAERKKLSELGDRYTRSFSAAELKEFITLRATASDYKSGLGLLATLRHDLERLSQLLHRQAGERDTADAPPPTVERIVLFIDDLDRCPPDRVVEVLQAVHLLLAFRLFVVVMGVDSRWIASCLAKKHSEILGDEDGAALRASDYLEKIFQIPYWLAPYSRTDAGSYFRALVRDTGLPVHHASTESPTSPENGGMTGGGSNAATGEAGGENQTPEGPVPWTEEELGFVSRLAPFAGTTPRATKRFFNLYHLLRHHPLLWPTLDQRVHQHSVNATFKAYAFALAVANSGSAGADALSARLHRKDGGPLDALIATPISAELRAALAEGRDQLGELDDGGNAAIEIALRLSFHGHRLMPWPPAAAAPPPPKAK